MIIDIFLIAQSIHNHILHVEKIALYTVHLEKCVQIPPEYCPENISIFLQYCHIPQNLLKLFNNVTIPTPHSF